MHSKTSRGAGTQNHNTSEHSGFSFQIYPTIQYSLENLSNFFYGKSVELIDKAAMQAVYFAFSLAQGMDAAFSGKFDELPANVQISLKNSKEFKEWHRSVEDYLDESLMSYRKLLNKFSNIVGAATNNDRLKEYVSVVQSFDYFQDRSNVASKIEKVNLVCWGLKEMSQLLLNHSRDELVDIVSFEDEPSKAGSQLRSIRRVPAKKTAPPVERRIIRQDSAAEYTEYIEDDANNSVYLPDLKRSRENSREILAKQNSKNRSRSSSIAGVDNPTKISAQDIAFDDSSMRNRSNRSVKSRNSPLKIPTVEIEGKKAVKQNSGKIDGTEFFPKIDIPVTTTAGKKAVKDDSEIRPTPLKRLPTPQEISQMMKVPPLTIRGSFRKTYIKNARRSQSTAQNQSFDLKESSKTISDVSVAPISAVKKKPEFASIRRYIPPSSAKASCLLERVRVKVFKAVKVEPALSQRSHSVETYKFEVKKPSSPEKKQTAEKIGRASCRER